MATLQKITPNLWFDTQAEAAAEFYTSIFPNSKVDRIARYPEAGEEIHKMTPGSIMTVDFELDGQSFVALNAGPVFKFNEAISFVVHCDTQQEVDDFWEKLGEGGDPNSQQCGWLKDKYGVSWQIVPRVSWAGRTIIGYFGGLRSTIVIAFQSFMGITRRLRFES